MLLHCGQVKRGRLEVLSCPARWEGWFPGASGSSGGSVASISC